MRKRQVSDPDTVAKALAHRFARMGQIVGGGGISYYELALCVRDSVGCDFETAGEAVLAATRARIGGGWEPVDAPVTELSVLEAACPWARPGRSRRSAVSRTPASRLGTTGMWWPTGQR